MLDSPTSPPSLRERKKRETRRALHKAAVDLVLEHGLEHVTVDDICALAGYAPRTFFNHFANKESALVIEPGDGLSELLERLPAKIKRNELIEELWAAMLVGFPEDTHDLELIKAHHELMERHPELLPQQMKAFVAVEQRLVEELSRRSEAESSWPQAEVAASLATAMMRSAFQRWVRDDGKHPFTEFLRTAIEAARELVHHTQD